MRDTDDCPVTAPSATVRAKSVLALNLLANGRADASAVSIRAVGALAYIRTDANAYIDGGLINIVDCGPLLVVAEDGSDASVVLKDETEPGNSFGLDLEGAIAEITGEPVEGGPQRINRAETRNGTLSVK